MLETYVFETGSTESRGENLGDQSRQVSFIKSKGIDGTIVWPSTRASPCPTSHTSSRSSTRTSGSSSSSLLSLVTAGYRMRIGVDIQVTIKVFISMMLEH